MHLKCITAMEGKEFMQVPGANNSKFGILVSKEDKSSELKDYHDIYNEEQILKNDNKGMFEMLSPYSSIKNITYI